ncbi:MAG TPA: phosphoribosylformylglycinamidine synthase subunit PurL, partial [Mucilaginibacter sp.]
GIGCAFKIESHNHPSALEPYQGAATGVGGINRDIFTMGARPIAQLNSLRFGDLKLEKTQWLVKGVVKGISHYGNAFGIPTVGGELFFDDCYNVNPLVNAMSAGIVKAGETVSATSYGVGNPVYIVGSATGKDGIHGAAFASKDITADSVNDLPAVQVGDPFQEKLLLEATLEVIKTGAVVGMQDMGAAGIICSNSEMSAKGEHGMRIDLDMVPTRQANMKPYEILLSESQERMLIVVHKGREKEVEAVFDKWDLNCAIIGEVTDTQRLEYYMHGEKVADVPADDLVLGGGAPVYQREYREPAYFAENQKFNIDDVPEPANLVEVAEHLSAHPNLASKRWVTDQYDSMVGVQTMTANLACDAAVVAVKDTNKAIVLTTDCNSRYVYADPYKGTAIAVAEAARNITCAGGEPVAITNCLNFGNPYNPEVYWQFVSAIKGMGDACRKFETPVTGGNVSFYNQSADGGSVFPTPTIGMLGVMEDTENIMTADFKQPGDLIYLIGESVNDIASSQYLASWHKITAAPAPYFDIDKEYAIQQTVKELIKHRVIESAHDVADGGLYINLLESAMPNGLGFDITTDDAIRKDAFLFGEAQGRVVVTVAPEEQERFIEFMATSETEFSLLGTVNNGFLNVDDELFGHVADVKMVHSNVLHSILGA